MSRSLFLVLGIVAAASLALVSCGGDDDDQPQPTVQRSSPTAPAQTPTSAVQSPTPASGFFDFSKATTTPSGLKYIDVAPGSGAPPRQDQLVSVNYTGRLATNGQTFDSTSGRQPATFQLTRVIKGFGEGLSTMKPGGKRILYIPANLAYGATPPQGSGIPANADLIFEVELVAVK